MHIGDIINGRYKILRQIGVGGMGAVYLVEDLELNSEVVAFKILHQQSDVDPEVFKRFRNEVLIARSLSHPGIVRTHDIGRADGDIYYITMEYIEGKTLKEILKQFDFNKSEHREKLFKYYLDVLAGVSYAHSKGVIHRDLKPANILIAKTGEAKIGDFGTARSVELSEGLTKTGFSVGTPEYMSPEQIRGETLDHTCDIYSLGVLLYEIITGSKPFSADSPIGIAYKQLNDPLPRLEEKGVVGFGKLEAIIDLCTKKSRGERYSCVEDLIKDFRRAIKADSHNSLDSSSGEFTFDPGPSSGSAWSLGGENIERNSVIDKFNKSEKKQNLLSLFLVAMVVGLIGSAYYFQSRAVLQVPEVPSLVDSSIGAEEGIVELSEDVSVNSDNLVPIPSPKKKPEAIVVPVNKVEVVAKVEKKDTSTLAVVVTPALSTPVPVLPTPTPVPSPVVQITQSYRADKFEVYTEERKDSVYSSVFAKQENISIRTELTLTENTLPFSSSDILKRTSLVLTDPKTSMEIERLVPEVTKVSEVSAQVLYRITPSQAVSYPNFLRIDFLIDSKPTKGTFIKYKENQKEVAPITQLPNDQNTSEYVEIKPVLVDPVSEAPTLVEPTPEIVPEVVAVPVNLSGTIDILDPLNGIKEPHGMEILLEKRKEVVSGTAKITALGTFKVSGKYYERGIELDLNGDKDSLKLVGGKRDSGFRGTFISTSGSSAKGTWAVR